MRTRAISISLILANAALILLLASCSGSREASAEEAIDTVAQSTTTPALPTQEPVQKDEGQPANDPQQVDPLAFVDEGYGIRLALPATWEGFQVGRFEHDGVTNLCFSFPESSPICVLQLDVYTKDAWAGLEKVHPDYFLAENDAFVFAAGPFTPECVQMDEFQCERYQEIPEILVNLEWH